VRLILSTNSIQVGFVVQQTTEKNHEAASEAFTGWSDSSSDP